MPLLAAAQQPKLSKMPRRHAPRGASIIVLTYNFCGLAIFWKGIIGNYWELLGNYWEIIGNYWEFIGELLGNYWELLGIIGNYWEIIAKILKIIGKNYRKTSKILQKLVDFYGFL